MHRFILVQGFRSKDSLGCYAVHVSVHRADERSLDEVVRDETLLRAPHAPSEGTAGGHAPARSSRKNGAMPRQTARNTMIDSPVHRILNATLDAVPCGATAKVVRDGTAPLATDLIVKGSPAVTLNSRRGRFLDYNFDF